MLRPCWSNGGNCWTAKITLGIMNRLKFLLAAFVVAVLALGIYSCAKDTEENNQGLNKVSLSVRSFDDSDRLITFEALSNPIRSDKFMIIGNRLSILIKNNPVFKEKLLSSFQSVNYDEVLLSDFLL